MNNHIIWLCVLDMRFLVLFGASAARMDEYCIVHGLLFTP